MLKCEEHGQTKVIHMFVIKYRFIVLKITTWNTQTKKGNKKTLKWADKFA